MSTRLLVDERWGGRHGIGRYSDEVLTRLQTAGEPLGAEGSPSSPLSALRLPNTVRAGDAIYTPGYNAFATRSHRQLLTLHDLIHLDARGLKRPAYAAYYSAVIRPAIRRAGSVVTVSETSRERIARWLRDDRVAIVNAGNAVSDAFVPVGGSAPAARDYVLYVGNLRAHKNVETLMRALALTEFDAVFVLPPGDGADARQKLTALGLSERAQVLHGVDDESLARYYRGAAVTAMPSLLEGFGLPALESVSCGTPVVYWTGCPSVAEIVGDRGLAVDDAQRPEEWAERLTAAARLDPSSWSERPRPSWDAVSARIDGALEQFLGR